MPSDNVLTARVADLLHLLEFATIHTPTEGDGPQIIDAIRDIKALLAAHPGQPEPRECRHCGWMCIPNSTPSTTHYPLPQPEPSGEVMAFTTTVGRLLATAPHFEECETPEPCLSALIHRYYENYFDREKGREYAELYIAALYEAARAQGGES